MQYRKIAWPILACLLLGARDNAPPAQQSIGVPYRLAPTQHIVVRAKINGKGPYNLILDTGAPLLVLAKKLEAPLAIQSDANGWATVDKFEIEGGVVIDKATVRFDDLYQLEGMNGLGVAGAEIHGLVGYPVLSRYRIEFDFNKPKLTWTPNNYAPDELPRAGKAIVPGGMNALAGVMKTLGQFMGMNRHQTAMFRPFLGMSVVENDGKLVVDSVLPEGPAAKAQPPIAAGDIVLSVGKSSTPNLGAFAKAVAELRAGDKAKLQLNHQGNKTTCELIPNGGF